MTADLRTALDPRSIAVVGASENPDKIGGRPLLYLSRFGFKGEVYPINPRGGDIQGLIKRLDYIEDLGTTAIWMTPSFKTRSVRCGRK